MNNPYRLLWNFKILKNGIGYQRGNCRSSFIDINVSDYWIINKLIVPIQKKPSLVTNIGHLLHLWSHFGNHNIKVFMTFCLTTQTFANCDGMYYHIITLYVVVILVLQSWSTFMSHNQSQPKNIKEEQSKTLFCVTIKVTLYGIPWSNIFRYISNW